MASTDVVAILAGGLSLTQEVVDAVRSAGLYVIVINDSWRLMPEADALFAADAQWWLARNPQLSPTGSEFMGRRFISEDQREPSARFIKPRTIEQGGNSALRATHWAEDELETRLALLFAVDLRDDELTHHHGQHQVGLGNPSVAVFGRARRAWEAYSREPGRIEIINCSPRSALTCFPKMTLEEALNVVWA